MSMVSQRRPSRRGRHQALHILTCFFVRLPTSVLCAFKIVDTAAHHSCQLPLQSIKSWSKIYRLDRAQNGRVVRDPAGTSADDSKAANGRRTCG